MPAKERARHWVFTVNNYTDTEVEDMQALADKEECKYMVYGKEVGEQTGTKHLQGYMEFAVQKTKKGILKCFKNPNQVSLRVKYNKSNPLEAALYCKKGEQSKEEWEKEKQDGPNFGKNADVFEKGEVSKERHDTGAKKGAEAMQEKYKNVKEKIVAKRKWEEVVQDDDPDVMEIHMKYPSWCKAIFQHKKKPRYDLDVDKVGYKWQRRLMNVLEKDPHPRRIYWLFDKDGNKGKSHLTRHLICNHDGVKLSNSKKDAAYMWNGERICMWDYPRSMSEVVNYGLIEDIKNGLVVNEKYESGMKVFDIPHVVIFANFEPDKTKFSKDRLCVVTDFSDTGASSVFGD